MSVNMAPVYDIAGELLEECALLSPAVKESGVQSSPQYAGQTATCVERQSVIAENRLLYNNSK